MPRSRAGPDGRTILVVEDQDDLRRVLVRVLQLEGYAVLQAQDGARALEVLDERGGAVDLVISDLVMPHVGGLELYERSREVAGGTAFLLTSGYDEQAFRKGLAGVPRRRLPGQALRRRRAAGPCPRAHRARARGAGLLSCRDVSTESPAAGAPALAEARTDR